MTTLRIKRYVVPKSVKLLVIEHVEFLSENQFSKEPIYFNDKLTCIIGGKSTGKSLLLNNIARIIDGQLFKDTHKKAGTEYNNEHDMKVYWGDGACTDGSNNSRKIIYIPQTYLNRLTDYPELFKLLSLRTSLTYLFS